MGTSDGREAEGAVNCGTERREGWKGNSKGMDEREKKRGGVGRAIGMMRMREKKQGRACMGRAMLFRCWR